MTKREELYAAASRYLVGGVSSSIRNTPVCDYPLYIGRGEGSRIWDVDANEYIDYCMSHGASFLGHNNPVIKKAIQKALQMGTICSYETEYQGSSPRRSAEWCRAVILSALPVRDRTPLSMRFELPEPTRKRTG